MANENALTQRKASGLRKSPYNNLTDDEIASLKADIAALQADESVFMFNEGNFTGYADDADTIFVKGDVFPDNEYSVHPRDMLSAKAVLAHEYYGHRANRGTHLREGAWNDEFRASYMAAKNAPGLTSQERALLLLDAMERAKEAGVAIKWNSFMRRAVYGSDFKQRKE